MEQTWYEKLILEYKATGKIPNKNVETTSNICKNTEKTSNEKGYEFETHVLNCLTNQGIDIKQTTLSCDQGADLIAIIHQKKIVIQCKNYEEKVSNSAIQEIFAAKSYYDADIAVVVTNNYFTDSAKKLALKCGVILVSKDNIGIFLNNATAFLKLENENNHSSSKEETLATKIMDEWFRK